MEHAKDNKQRGHMPGTFLSKEPSDASPPPPIENQHEALHERRKRAAEARGMSAEAQLEGRRRQQGSQGDETPSVRAPESELYEGHTSHTEHRQGVYEPRYPEQPNDQYWYDERQHDSLPWPEVGSDYEHDYHWHEDELHSNDGRAPPNHDTRQHMTHDYDPYLRARAQYQAQPEYHQAARPRQRDRSGYRQHNGHNVQVNAQPPPQPPAGAQVPSLGETMQTMMMSQMMMQQMQAQQMQQAQMAALSAKTFHVQAQQPGAVDRGCKRKGSTSLNIQNCNGGSRKKGKRKQGVQVAQVDVRKPHRAPAELQLSPSESSALDNWQEATIILCLVIVGLIYLVSSRATPQIKKKEPSLAAKYLT